MIIKKNNQKKPNRSEPKVVQPQEEKLEVQPVPVETKTIIRDEPQEIEQEDSTDIFAGFDFDKIDFNQRAERRRGDRRRGYRRIDDRNLISRAQQEAIDIKEQASKEGYEKGIEAANSAVEELRNSIIGFFEYKEELYNQISEDILDILPSEKACFKKIQRA